MLEVLKLWTKDKVHLTIWIAIAFLTPSIWYLLGELLVSQSTQEKTILILARGLGVMTSISLGLLLSLIRVSRKKPINTAYKKIKSKKDISDIALKILIFLGERGELVMPVTFFYEKFNLTLNQAQYAIEELLQFDLLETDTEKQFDRYSLSSNGRKFLSKNKLL